MNEIEEQDDSAIAARRTLLKLSAAGAVGVLTIRPGVAQAAASVLTCQIPVPDPARAGNYIAADGSLVPPGTAGAFAPPSMPLKATDVQKALGGLTLPGTTPEASQAYVNYVRRLQHGTAGFTCFASLQMPR